MQVSKMGNQKEIGTLFRRSPFCCSSFRFHWYLNLLIVDMKAFNDDDHVIAVFRDDGYWGAVAKSNFTSLRFREPVYRSLRELIMSYFDFFFNIYGEKSLRSYSLPFDLSTFNNRNWATTDDDLEYIGDKIESLHHFPVVSEKMIKKAQYCKQFNAQGRNAWIET